jgi:predicted nucleic acid-binding protein
MVRDIVARADGRRMTVELSGVVRAELLVGPLRTRDGRELRRILDLAHRRRGVEAAAISEEVLTTSSEIRAVTKLKMMDAIIVASAAVHGCQAIVGNDEGFAVINRFDVVPALAARRTPLPMPKYLHLDDFV